MPADRAGTAYLVERMCSWLVLAIGVLVLVGGAGDAPVLTRWWPHLPSTVPITGLVAVSVGSGLLLRRHQGVAVVIAAGGLFLTILAVITRVAGWRHPFESWWMGDTVEELDRHGLPPASTLIGLLVISAAVVLIVAGRERAAQALAALGGGIGWLAALAVLYGDRLATITGSSFPETTTSLPAALGLLVAAVAVFAASPTDGREWMAQCREPGPPRRAATAPGGPRGAAAVGRVCRGGSISTTVWVNRGHGRR